MHIAICLSVSHESHISLKNKAMTILHTYSVSDHHHTQGLKILLVEDNPLIQKVIRISLSYFGHQLTVADNGYSALEIYPTQEFDIILMDIRMPLMGGIETTKELRKRHNNLPPIIGLSANAMLTDREQFISQGLDEYLAKPLDIDDFERVVSRLLNTSKLYSD